MNSTKKTARIAGVLYLVNGVTGFFSITMFPASCSYLETQRRLPTTSSLPRDFSALVSLPK
jgi:hypothetical protein